MNATPTTPGPERAGRAERALTLLLKFLALAECTAAIGVVMPASIMARIAGWLGLGAFPAGPLAPYLARSLAAMYVVHGGFAWVTSCNVRAYGAFVRYLAVSGIAYSVLITVLDIQAGFPWYWWVGEGPFLTVYSIALLALLRAVPPSRSTGG